MTRRHNHKARRESPEFMLCRRRGESPHSGAALPRFDIDDLGYLARQIFAKQALTPERFERWLATSLDQVAIIISHTYAERGDAAELADDVALAMIRDLLLDVDAHLIERNKDKSLPRRAWRALARAAGNR